MYHVFGISTKLSAPFALVFVHLFVCAEYGHKKGRRGPLSCNCAGCSRFSGHFAGMCPNKRPQLCPFCFGPFPGPLLHFLPWMCFYIPCTAKIKINYENDLFIAGNVVLKNYYTIFDVDNKILSILPRNDDNTKQTGKYLALFFIVLILAFVSLFGWYYYYNKYHLNLNYLLNQILL